MFGVSHGAVQFLLYEQMKNYSNQRQHRPVDHKLVWVYLYLHRNC